MINEEQMMSLLKERFPKLKLALRSEFSGNCDDKGLWFKSSTITESFDGDEFEIPLIDENYEINSTLNKFLEDNGWFAEPYDGETLTAYPI